MKEPLKDKIPISGIVLPFLYGFSGVICMIFSVEVNNSIFTIDSLLTPEHNIMKIGFFHFIYACIIRLLFVKFREVYISLLLVFAFYEIGTFCLDTHIFILHSIPHILYTAVFHLGLFTLLMYERRLFKR